jgi:hypothetical protein
MIVLTKPAAIYPKPEGASSLDGAADHYVIIGHQDTSGVHMPMRNWKILNAGLFFRKVACKACGIPWLVKRVNFTNGDIMKEL